METKNDNHQKIIQLYYFGCLVFFMNFDIACHENFEIYLARGQRKAMPFNSCKSIGSSRTSDRFGICILRNAIKLSTFRTRHDKLKCKQMTSECDVHANIQLSQTILCCFFSILFQIDGGDYIKYLQKKYRKISILVLNRNRNIVYVARYSETKSLVHTQIHSRHLTRILKVEVIVSGGCCAFF